MTRSSDRFEQLVHAINQLVQAGAVVTWDDRIVDPDTPDHYRQVDVTIKRDGLLTLVECREHKSPQDVKWIEELIGRRISLGADSVIAVSSSGFYEPAITKAQRHGVITRELRALSEQEIQGWGRRTEVTIYYYQFSEVAIEIRFPVEPQDLTVKNVTDALRESPILAHLMRITADQTDAQINPFTGRAKKAKVQFTADGITNLAVGSHAIAEVGFSAVIGSSALKATAPVVRAYASPADSASADAIVETYGLGNTGVIHKGEQVTCILDLTGVELPTMSLFRYVRFEGQEESVIESFQLVGVDQMMRLDDQVSVTLSYLSDK